MIGGAGNDTPGEGDDIFVVEVPTRVGIVSSAALASIIIRFWVVGDDTFTLGLAGPRTASN